MLERDEAAERALIGEVTQRDLVREQPNTSMADEPEYRFRHVLVSDVCYERLPMGERIARHVRAADWLDARLDGRGTELAEDVAHHRFTAVAQRRRRITHAIDSLPNGRTLPVSLLRSAWPWPLASLAVAACSSVGKDLDAMRT